GRTRSVTARASPRTATANTAKACWPSSSAASCNRHLRAGDRLPLPCTSGRGRTMLLRHATLIRNLPNIQRHGLLCSKSKGRLKAVWLATREKSSWAALHVVERHGGRIEAVVTLEVDVPRSWLRRSRKGLWYSTRDIPPERIRRLFGFVELARVAG